jgi:hypothetical protein
VRACVRVDYDTKEGGVHFLLKKGMRCCERREKASNAKRGEIQTRIRSGWTRGPNQAPPQSSASIPSGLFNPPAPISTPGSGHLLAKLLTSAFNAFTSALASATRRKSFRSFEPASFWSESESWTVRWRKEATVLWSASVMLREVRAEVPSRMPPGVWADSAR